MFLYGYGAALLSQDRLAVPLGWALAVILVGGGAYEGMLGWHTWQVVMILQIALAIYSHLRRNVILTAHFGATPSNGG